MEKMPTKQRILKEALTLFAEKGYEAVNVAEIAEAVGIKAPSLYKHYKNKQDIFEAILDEMEKRYKKQAASMNMNGTEVDEDKDVFLKMDEEELVKIGKDLFGFFLHDEYTCQFRRMLTIEQFNNKALSDIYIKRYIDDSLSYQGMALGFLMKAGVLLPENPEIAALQFYAPIFLLLTLCDSHPEREADAIQMIEDHLRQFNRLYGNKKI